MNPQNKQDPTDDAAILRLARERFKLAQEAETDIRRDALDDMKFRAGQQWPDEIKTARNIDKRPCLTINRLPQFLRQVTNELRQNRPGIQVDPVDDKGDKDTAKVLQGMVRHIEYASNAEVAYDTAVDGQCTGGFGFFRVITKYCDPLSFKQDLEIKRIRDAMSVSMDPSYQEPDGSDANWAFVNEDISKEEFKHRFPDAKMSNDQMWEVYASNTPSWVTLSGCRISEYFVRSYKKETVCQLSTGETVKKSEITPEMYAEMKSDAVPVEGQMAPPVRIINERMTEVPYINWYKMNGVEILERTEWLGKWIPIIPVLGDEMIVDGKRVLEGVIRHAKDPQRMYNYWATSETEMIALAPRAPFVGAAGQFKGHEKAWQTANTRNVPYLEYEPKALNGQPVGPPTRQVFEPPVQAITQARQMAAEDLKATTGIYDAALGNRSNEQSGVAIQRRNMQSETANYHYSDNLKRSIRHVGRILVDLIPKIYDEEQAVRTLGADGTQEIVVINKMFVKDGKQMGYFLDQGTYDVTVTTGPSYQTKRQEAVASMLDLAKAIPESMKVALDLLVKNMDWPGAQEIADRLKKTLPPGIAEPEDGEQPPIPPQAAQMIAQMQQMIKVMTAQLKQSNDVIDNKKIELATKERIEILKMQNDLVLQQMKNDASHSQTAFLAEVDVLKKRLDMLPLDSELNSGPGPAAAVPSQSTPTGGPPPGQPMGV